MKYCHAKIFPALLAAFLPLLCAAGIELTSPACDSEVALFRSDWREQIALRGKLKGTQKKETRIDFPEKVVFSFRSSQKVSQAVLEISRDRDFKTLVRQLPFGDSSSLSVANLEIGRKYFWRVRCGKEHSDVWSFSTRSDAPRFLAVPGGSPGNFRDFGGRVTLDGKRVRQNMIFRGTEMHGRFVITDAGKEFMLKELGIKIDLDFRYPAQTAKHTQSALGSSVKWVKIPIHAYNNFTPEQMGLFRDAIRFFADPAHYPVYMHCVGGVDRTGEIAYLLNMILNVDEESVLLDYEASTLCIFPRQRTTPYFIKWRKNLSDMSPPGTSPQLQVINYLKKIGVTDAEINSIRNILIEK